MQSYQTSVVERECVEGIINTDYVTKYTTLAFLRKIDDINMSDTRGGEHQQPQCFVDLHQKQLDKSAMELANKLREEIVPDNLEKSNIRTYQVDWNAFTGQNPAAYDEYMKSFLQDFYVNVTKLVDKAMKVVDTSIRGIMANEIHKHLYICVENAKKFLGREAELYSVKNYILGNLKRPFLIYGQTGTGKSMFTSKIAISCRTWLPSPKVSKLELLTVVRYLGVTPTSSSVPTLVLSICQQICYHMEIPIEEIPEDFVPLSNYFKMLLERSSEKFFLVILLDAIEIFFVNSHQNGATSWIPRDLPKNVKILITFTTDPKEDAIEKSKFLTAFCKGVTDQNNMLHLDQLGAELSEKVLQYWMANINRSLSNYQWRVAMNAMHTCSLALFLDLCFSLMKTWKSYDLPETTVIPQSFNAGINELFENVERKFGHILVSHAVSYITASKSGLSETELEDILCLDEEVLDEVFRFSMPEARRIPPILWTKIRRDLKEHFTEHEADGSRVVVWAHKTFRDVATQLYLKTESISVYLHGIMSDYFLGVWAGGRPKPFKYSQLHRVRFGVTGRMGQSDRKMPAQPNVFMGTDGKISRYNMRKFAELPFHLIGSNRVQDLCDNVLFNYHWLHSKISAVPIMNILEDFSHALTVIKDPILRRQVKLVLGALQLSRTVLDKYPDMLSAHFIGRLLPEVRNLSYIRSLVHQCDNEGFVHNCLVPLRHYLASPGGPLKYTLEGHKFAIFACALTNDKRYVVSISNRFLSWDVSSSEVCRDIDPRSDGMILGLALSMDDRFAAAYTINKQLVIIDIMLGHYIKVERPMDKHDDIVDIAITEDSVIVYNSKYWRAFDMNGQHTSSENFAIELSDVLKMLFITDKVYLSLHWTGDTDFDDTRIWVQTVVHREKSEPVMVYNACEMASFTEDKLVYFACQKNTSTYLEPSTEHEKWSLLRYEQDPRGNAKEKACILCPEIDDVFGLKLHTFEEEDQDPRFKNLVVLSCALPDSFLLVFDPLMGDHNQLDRMVKKLSLPRSVVNIRIKLNLSNPCILVPEYKYLVAGVRRDIFVWDWNKAQLLRSFVAHMGRILDMKALLTNNTKVFISSSNDKSIKVWEVENLLEFVHPVEQMEMKIDKLVLCEPANTVVSLTRGGLGFWSMETGALEYRIADTTGGYVTDVAVDADGRYFVTAESDQRVLMWNLKSRVVLQKDFQTDVVQLMILEENRPDTILAISKLKDQKSSSGGEIYRVIGRSENGKRAFKFDCPIKKHFPLIQSNDKRFLAILGYDKAKNKDAVMVYHSQKGVFLHKVILKYPQMKRPLTFLPFQDSLSVIIDSEKANIIDLKNKRYTRSIRNWTGQSIGEDSRYGLSAPQSGGLRYMDLKTGSILQPILENASEGVCTIHADFTGCGRYILYYHNARRTVRLFKRDDGKSVANYCLHTEATSFLSTKDGNRLIIGGQDGSVTFLVVAHNTTPEQLDESRTILRRLPSRKRQKRHYDEDNKENKAPGGADAGEEGRKSSQSSATSSSELFLQRELEKRKLHKVQTLRRFRAVVRVALIMERVGRSMRSTSNKKMKKKDICSIS